MKKIAVFGLLMVLGFIAQPCYAAQVYMVNNSSQKVYVNFSVDVVIPLYGGPYQISHSLDAGSHRTSKFDDIFTTLTGEMDVFIDGQRKPSCDHDEGERFYFVRITVQDTPGGNIASRIIVKDTPGGGIACDFKFRN